MNLEALFKISYGLYIVSSKDGEKINAHISNTFFQVTAEPPQFAICTNKENLTTDYIHKSKVFAVSVIQQDVDLQFIGIFGFKSGRDTNKFESVHYKTGSTGAPIVLDKTIAFVECEVNQEIDTGTHIIFIGTAVNADILSDNKPLTYSYYRDVIKGISPKNAPTYIDKSKLNIQKIKEKTIYDKYYCTVCGYVYDPEIGDDNSGIKPGTLFEDLPDDWSCPVCGATKDMFLKQ